MRKRGIKLRLVDQSFEILAMLLEHAGEVVTREALRRRLWPDAVYVDFDNNLNKAMAKLREVLGDSPARTRFIETLPKRGYRFIGTVSRVESARPRLLVMPFLNLSGDSSQEYFSEAMTEEIIGALASVAAESLAVIARTTAMHYKGSERAVGAIGRELSLDYIVEGSARKENGRVTANVQLIRVRDESHLWSQHYDAEMSDLLNIEIGIAEAIAARIGLSPRPGARKSVMDVVAYDLYSKGRYHLSTPTLKDMEKAQHLLEQAIARAPDFALAYDSLGEVFWYRGFWGLDPPRRACSEGIYYLLRALEIDNRLAETHALLAMYRKGLGYDWTEVHREIVLARKLNPASPLVKERAAIIDSLPHGLMNEAVAELEGALESDPLSPSIRGWLVTCLWLGHHSDRAIEEARTLLELHPTGHISYFVAGFCYCDKGMFPEAIAAHRKAAELSGGSPAMLGWLGLTLAQSGAAAEAREILDGLLLLARDRYIAPTSIAWIHLGLGEIDEAYTWMDRAAECGDQMLVPILTYQFFDPLRSDARFEALLRKMNLDAKSEERRALLIERERAG